MISRCLAALARLEDALLIVLLLGLIGLAGSQIALRNFGGPSLIWAEPVLRAGVLWLALLGAAVATRQRKQITVDVFTRRLPGRWRDGAGLLTQGFAATVGTLLAWHSLRFVHDEFRYGGEWIAGIPSWLPAAPMPALFALIALRYALFALGDGARLMRSPR